MKPCVRETIIKEERSRAMAYRSPALIEGPRILYRQGIKEKLSGIFESPMFYVIAGMGYGKSTAVRNFLEHRRRIRTIWFSFREEEVEDLWLWVRFSKLVEKKNKGLGRSLFEYGMPYNKYDMERLEQSLREVIEIETVVVFDDMQCCTSPYIEGLLRKIAEMAIPFLHIVLISREYPAYDISAALSTQKIRIMTQKDFLFTKTECSDFFILNDAALGPEEIELLWQHTGGWASGLYLALMYYRSYGTLSIMPEGDELMRRAIYDRFELETKKSLLILSRIRYFRLDQAEIITGDRSIRNVISNMYTSFCFMKYDDETDDYSFHSLLWSLLDSEFRNAGINENDIYEKQGLWCLASDDKIGAIRAFSRCRDHERILSIMAEPNSTQLMDLSPNIIIEAFMQMDEDMKLSNPLGYLSFIYSYSTHIDVEKGAEMLKSAKEYYSDPLKSPDIVGRNQLLGEIALIESVRAFNDLEAMFRCYERAFDYFDGGTSVIYTSDINITFGIPLTMFLYHRELGELEHLVKLVENEFWIYSHITNGSGTGFEFLLRSEFEFKKGNFEEAEMLAYKAVYKGQMRDQCDIILSASFVILRIDLFKGHFREVNDILLQLMQEVERNGSPVMLACYEFILGYVFSFLGMFELVPKWINIQGADNSRFMAISRNSAYIIRGKYLSEYGDYKALLQLARRMMPVYDRHKTIDGVMIFKVFEAIALFHLEGKEAGIESLKEALAIAEKDGIVVTIGENTYEVIPMLEEINTPFARRVLDFAQQYVTAKNNYRSRTRHEELTNREIEVMDLVCDGLTAEAIAEKLYISHSTVKKHMANIYQKLGVNKKADAIAEYRKRRSRRRVRKTGLLDGR